MTRGSITGQVKALSMIVAIEGLIPDRRAVPAQNKTAPPPVTAQIYQPPPGFASSRGKPSTPSQALHLPKKKMTRPASRGACRAPASPGSARTPASVAPNSVFDPSESAFANRFKPLATTPSSPHARVPASAPDERVPSSIEKNPSTWRLRL